MGPRPSRSFLFVVRSDRSDLDDRRGRLRRMRSQGGVALVGPVGQLHDVGHLVILYRGLDDAETFGVEEEGMAAEHGLELRRSGMIVRNRLALHALLDAFDLSGR